jgi:myosin heavy subunit
VRMEREMMLEELERYEVAALMIQRWWRGLRVRRLYTPVLKRRKLERNQRYFDEMRVRVLTDAQLVIRKYWLLYRENKQYFRQQNFIKKTQNAVKNYMSQKKKNSMNMKHSKNSIVTLLDSSGSKKSK